MKKLVVFISFIIFLGIGFLYILNKPKSYETEYNVDGYTITEKYDKKASYYNYVLMKDDLSFNFVSQASYSSHRKMITKIIEEKNDDALCVQPEAKNDSFQMICYKNKEYVDKYLANIESVSIPKRINKVANIDIYDKDHEFIIWNNKGFKLLAENKDFKFLSKESYDNLLTYQGKDYIIVADYDQSRTFNKLYIYKEDKKEMDTWDLGVDISFESYFMGEIDDCVYLFDKKNKIQYSLDVSDKKIKITSDKDGALYYDRGLTHKSLDMLSYNEMKFEYENKYNFILEDNKLYLRFYGTEQKIRISDKEVAHVVYATDEEVYYLVNEELYSYNVNTGEKLLLINFEWNFTYLNKIFIFD